ncbi:prolipoprotein diacylglyceryl transferase [Alkaliphilus peptidifermentans]|uniref:Phosphatidylglycerol--prolipoprotein diacylglyceryl transferase n=1 Tax=Alkaliphilus peptidifermentans DSM 18978 TaxID=1120976 RepID=A0A1G5DQD5_9FIRM|nr:prolipoprotein diacylglyceryl transferase [Alkaliphilus peptidifermentans]SCY16817.1 phosphatidylglycerol:prolipoprotein diacylglycerol transferase [Alkaliphilus peptidifermentans DSM 18978]
MKILFTIGGFYVHLFGLMIGLGALAGFYIVIREARRKKMDEDKLLNLAIYCFIIGVVGARLNYIISFNLQYFLRNPHEIFMLQNGGLSIQGGLIAGIIFALWYIRKNRMNVGKVADIYAPAIIIGQAIGRVGCDVFGIAMSKEWFWGVNIGGQLLHPAQIYEAVLNYLLFGVLWMKRKNTAYDGQLFVIYLIGFSINRFIVEFFRTNPLIFGPISIAHIFSVILVIASIGLMIIFKKVHQTPLISEANNTIAKEDIEWRSVGIIIAMIIISIVFYYYIHSI